MKAGDAPLYVFDEIGKTGAKRGAAGDNHIIETVLARAWQGVAHGGTKAPADAVPFHGIAVFLRDGQANAGSIVVRAVTALQEQGAGIGTLPSGSGQKVLALDEPVHGGAPILRRQGGAPQPYGAEVVLRRTGACGHAPGGH